MRIGEVTGRTGVATRMLRYYEEQDLLTPQRHGNGYRDYTEGDVRRVETIRDLSASGVPTRFIKIVLDRQSGTTPWTRNCDPIRADMARCQIAELDGKISCLTTSREALRTFLDDAATSVVHN